MVTDRARAKALGLDRYNTGKPCVRGHMSERRTRSAQCVECDRQDKLSSYHADPAKKLDANSRYRSHNKGKVLSLSAKWKKANPGIATAHTQARRARKLSATPCWYGELDEFVMREAHSLAKAREKSTGFKWELDHIVPLSSKSVCGLHCAANIRVIPMTENRRKGNRHAV